jgi:hypothetical protein
MMVADVCLSLSRMKEDKVLGTGRIHVMKNRYGMDGHTWDAKVNTNNGHIEILGSMSENILPNQPAGNFKELANKFFSLENEKQ